MTQNLKNILIAAGIAFGPMIIAGETEGTQSTSALSQPGKAQSNTRATLSTSALSSPTSFERDDVSLVSPNDDFDNIPDETTDTPNWSTSALLSSDDNSNSILNANLYNPNGNSTGAPIAPEYDFDDALDEDLPDQDWTSEPSVSPEDAWCDTHSIDIDSIADKDEGSEERKSTNTTETYVSYRSGLNGNIAAVQNDREIESSTEIANAQSTGKALPLSWNSESTLSRPETSRIDTRSTGMLVSPKEFYDPSYPLTFESRNNK